MSGGFEEKLNSILNDQQAMGQIMALAKSLSAGEEGGPPQSQAEGDYVPVEEACSEAGPSLAEGLDPALMSMGLKLLGEYKRTDSRSEALLQALRPYLKPQRRDGIDRAVSIARLSRVATLLLRSMGRDGGGDGDV